MPVDVKDYDKVIASMKKEYGAESIRVGSDYPEVQRIPTGIVGLDTLIGGGIPLGRWSHFYGGFSTCKTLLSIHTIKNAQKMGLKCAYYDIENQFDPIWFKSVGVDIDNLLIVDGSIIEDVGVKLEALMSVVHVHVVDSVGLGVSKDELATDLDKWLPGINARAWGKVLRNWNERFDKENNAIILINQTRQVFGKNREEPTGGNSINFISSLSLNLTKSSWLYEDKKGNLSPEGMKTNSFSGDTDPSGIELLVRVDKSRIANCKQNAVGRVRLAFESDGQFDDIWTLSRAAIWHGLVEKSGTWYTLPNGEKVQGETGIRGYIEENEDFAMEIKKRLYNNE